MNGDPLTRGRLVALHGETAKAEAQIQVFEKAIEQPLNAGVRTGRPSKSHYPDNDLSSQKARQGTSVGYLMGRLLKIDPDIQDRIGKCGTVCRVVFIGVVVAHSRVRKQCPTVWGVALGVLIGAIPAGLVFHCLLQLVGLITRRSTKPSGRFHAVQH